MEKVKQSYGILLLLLLSVGVTAQIEVMTYNIRNSNARDGENQWDKRKHRLSALIRKVNPDVLGTQEVLSDQLHDLQAEFKDYIAFGVGRDNGKHAGEHCAIFIRKDKFDLLNGGNFWLSERPERVGSISWDAAITRICTWVKLKDILTGTEFIVLNTHLDHKGEVARRKSAQLIRNRADNLAGQLPVIVTGDFNFTPTDTAYAYMLTDRDHTALLKDTYNSHSPDFTCCGFKVSNTDCSRIDYIFCSAGLITSDYTVHSDNNGTNYPSDHLPVSVKVNLHSRKRQDLTPDKK